MTPGPESSSRHEKIAKGGFGKCRPLGTLIGPQGRQKTIRDERRGEDKEGRKQGARGRVMRRKRRRRRKRKRKGRKRRRGEKEEEEDRRRKRRRLGGVGREEEGREGRRSGRSGLPRALNQEWSGAAPGHNFHDGLQKRRCAAQRCFKP